MSRSGEFRRQAYEKRKVWAHRVACKRYSTESPGDRIVGRLLNTRALCSCYMCGNPRKHFGQKTLQELRNV